MTPSPEIIRTDPDDRCACVRDENGEYTHYCAYCRNWEQQWKVEQEADRIHQRKQRIADRLLTIPERLRRHSLETIAPLDPRQMAAIAACRNYVSGFSATTETGLYFVGPKGRGKSLLAACVLRSLIERGKTGHFYTFSEMLRELKMEFDDHGDERDLMGDLISARIVVIDDLGSSEKYTDFAREQLYLLINSRYAQCRPVLVTSNLPLNAPQGLTIGSEIGERLESRLREICTQVPCAGNDLRGTT